MKRPRLPRKAFVAAEQRDGSLCWPDVQEAEGRKKDPKRINNKPRPETAICVGAEGWVSSGVESMAIHISPPN